MESQIEYGFPPVHSPPQLGSARVPPSKQGSCFMVLCLLRYAVQL